MGRGPLCGLGMAPRAKLALDRARRIAKAGHRTRFDSTDLLLGLLEIDDGMAVRLLRGLGVDPAAVRARLPVRAADRPQRRWAPPLGEPGPGQSIGIRRAVSASGGQSERLLHAAGEQPSPQPHRIQPAQAGHPPGQPGRVGVEPLLAVEQVLQRVVRRVTDVGLGVDDQPRLPLGGQHIARVQIGGQQHLPVGAGRHGPEQRDARPGQAWVDQPGAAVEPDGELVGPGSHIAFSGRNRTTAPARTTAGAAGRR